MSRVPFESLTPHHNSAGQETSRTEASNSSDLSWLLSLNEKSIVDGNGSISLDSLYTPGSLVASGAHGNSKLTLGIPGGGRGPSTGGKNASDKKTKTISETLGLVKGAKNYRLNSPYLPSSRPSSMQGASEEGGARSGSRNRISSAGAGSKSRPGSNVHASKPNSADQPPTAGERRTTPKASASASTGLGKDAIQLRQHTAGNDAVTAAGAQAELVDSRSVISGLDGERSVAALGQRLGLGLGGEMEGSVASVDTAEGLTAENSFVGDAGAAASRGAMAKNSAANARGSHSRSRQRAKSSDRSSSTSTLMARIHKSLLATATAQPIYNTSADFAFSSNDSKDRTRTHYEEKEQNGRQSLLNETIANIEKHAKLETHRRMMALVHSFKEKAGDFTIPKIDPLAEFGGAARATDSKYSEYYKHKLGIVRDIQAYPNEPGFSRTESEKAPDALLSAPTPVEISAEGSPPLNRDPLYRILQEECETFREGGGVGGAKRNRTAYLAVHADFLMTIETLGALGKMDHPSSEVWYTMRAVYFLFLCFYETEVEPSPLISNMLEAGLIGSEMPVISTASTSTSASASPNTNTNSRSAGKHADNDEIQTITPGMINLYHFWRNFGDVAFLNGVHSRNFINTFHWGLIESLLMYPQPFIHALYDIENGQLTLPKILPFERPTPHPSSLSGIVTGGTSRINWKSGPFYRETFSDTGNEFLFNSLRYLIGNKVFHPSSTCKTALCVSVLCSWARGICAGLYTGKVILSRAGNAFPLLAAEPYRTLTESGGSVGGFGPEVPASSAAATATTSRTLQHAVQSIHSSDSHGHGHSDKSMDNVDTAAASMSGIATFAGSSIDEAKLRAIIARNQRPSRSGTASANTSPLPSPAKGQKRNVLSNDNGKTVDGTGPNGSGILSVVAAEGAWGRGGALNASANLTDVDGPRDDSAGTVVSLVSNGSVGSLVGLGLARLGNFPLPTNSYNSLVGGVLPVLKAEKNAKSSPVKRISHFIATSTLQQNEIVQSDPSDVLLQEYRIRMLERRHLAQQINGATNTASPIYIIAYIPAIQFPQSIATEGAGAGHGFSFGQQGYSLIDAALSLGRPCDCIDLCVADTSRGSYGKFANENTGVSYYTRRVAASSQSPLHRVLTSPYLKALAPSPTSAAAFSESAVSANQQSAHRDSSASAPVSFKAVVRSSQRLVANSYYAMQTIFTAAPTGTSGMASGGSEYRSTSAGAATGAALHASSTSSLSYKLLAEQEMLRERISVEKPAGSALESNEDQFFAYLRRVMTTAKSGSDDTGVSTSVTTATMNKPPVFILVKDLDHVFSESQAWVVPPILLLVPSSGSGSGVSHSAVAVPRSMSPFPTHPSGASASGSASAGTYISRYVCLIAHGSRSYHAFQSMLKIAKPGDSLVLLHVSDINSSGGGSDAAAAAAAVGPDTAQGSQDKENALVQQYKALGFNLEVVHLPGGAASASAAAARARDPLQWGKVLLREAAGFHPTHLVLGADAQDLHFAVYQHHAAQAQAQAQVHSPLRLKATGAATAAASATATATAGGVSTPHAPTVVEGIIRQVKYQHNNNNRSSSSNAMPHLSLPSHHGSSSSSSSGPAGNAAERSGAHTSPFCPVLVLCSS